MSAAALAITLLLERGQRVRYLPGVAVNRIAGACRGEGMTDAKDAAVIAGQARTVTCVSYTSMTPCRPPVTGMP